MAIVENNDVLLSDDGYWFRCQNKYSQLKNCPSIGKWMHFFNDFQVRGSAENTYTAVHDAVSMGIVQSAKCRASSEGVACFYVDGFALDQHRRLLAYMVERELIRRTKNGRLYNIGFKFDFQTRNMEYGTKFVSCLKLHDLLDPVTGDWLDVFPGVTRVNFVTGEVIE